jgi:two-component system sensor histidine kinase UhpB
MTPSAASLPEPFQRFLEHTSDGVVVADDTGRILYVNPIAATLFGYAPEELIDHPVEILIPEVFRGAHERHRVAYGRTPRLRPMGAGLQLYGRHKSGRKVPVEINLRPEATVGGLIVAAVIRDLTATKALEAELEERGRHLSAIFDHTYQFIGLLQPDGTVLEANRSSLTFIGATLVDVVGQPFWETPWWRDEPDDRERLRAAIGAAAAGERVRFGTRHRDAAGRPAAIDFSLTPARNADGRVVYLVAEGRDVSALKAAEDALRESEARYALACRGSHDGLWDWNLANREYYLSPRWKELLGFEDHELPNIEASFFGRLHPEDGPRVREAVDRHFTQRGPFGIELRLQCKDGGYRWFLSRGQAIWDSSGQPVRMAGSITDITERKGHQAELEALNAALEARVQRRTAELERRARQLSQLATELTLAEQHAREQLAKTLHDGLQQLLFSAKLRLDSLDPGSKRASPEEANALASVRADLVEAIAAARSLAMELFPPALHTDGLPAALTWLAGRMRQQYALDVQVSADPEADAQRRDIRTLVFESARELLFNTVKHAQVERATVDLRLDEESNLSLTVADEGAGFDPSALDGTGAPAGWGLLRIRERLTLLGGRFEVESTPGRGARFRLTAPR